MKLILVSFFGTGYRTLSVRRSRRVHEFVRGCWLLIIASDPLFDFVACGNLLFKMANIYNLPSMINAVTAPIATIIKLKK